MRFLCLLLALVASTALAEIDVKVKKAKSVITAKTTEVMRLETEDGIAIGREVTRELDPVVRPGQPAAIIIVKPDRPADQIELIKLKCDTAEVHPIADAPGYFGISKPGKHTVSVNVFGKNPFTWDDKTVLVEVGQGPNPPPVPPGPVPPGPTPGPSPIDGDGLRVLMIWESSEANLLTAGQSDIMYGPEVRDFLNANCIKVDGTPDWRRIDQDAKFTDPNDRFAKALARPRASIPWVIVSNGTSGYEGPMPATKEEMIELVSAFKPSQSQLAAGVFKRRALPPKVTMYTIAGCVWCERFKQSERHLLKVPFAESYQSRSGVTRFPSFLVEANGRSVLLTGYRTAAQLHNEIKKLEAM